MKNKNPDALYRLLLIELEKVSRQKLSSSEKAVFMQYCLSRDYYQPVTVVIGKLEAEALFKSVISRLQQGGILFTDENIFLSVPVEMHALSMRLIYSLKRAQCKTMCDVIKLNRTQLLKVGGLGAGSVAELVHYLGRAGFSLPV